MCMCQVQYWDGSEQRCGSAGTGDGYWGMGTGWVYGRVIPVPSHVLEGEVRTSEAGPVRPSGPGVGGF